MKIGLKLFYLILKIACIAFIFNLQYYFIKNVKNKLTESMLITNLKVSHLKIKLPRGICLLFGTTALE